MTFQNRRLGGAKFLSAQFLRVTRRTRPLYLALAVLYLFVPWRVVLAENAIPADAQTAIDAANGEWVAALEAGNVKLACQGFADDALFISEDGKVTSGTLAFESALQKRFDAGLKITGGKVTSLGAYLVNGLIVEWGSSLLDIADKAGVRRKGGGDYLAVWSKGKDGAWRIIRNISLGAQHS
jgi:ketosteroid isomerase-like protein